MAPFLILLFISSLLSSHLLATTQSDLPETAAEDPSQMMPEPLVDSTPPPSPEQDAGLSGSSVSPFAAPAGVANQVQPVAGNETASSEPEPEQVQPIVVEQGQGQGQEQGQQQQQTIGLGAQSLVDNTPFGSGSSRVLMMGCGSWFGFALALVWFAQV